MKIRRSIAKLMIALTVLLQIFTAGSSVWADGYRGSRVVTLGADLTEQQKRDILNFFGVSEGDVQIVYITNTDERQLLSGHFSDAEIGTRTFSCAYISVTSSGGIFTKIGNLNKVTSQDITQALMFSGVYNCEVLTAAPFEVSGTGALTGVLKAYEYVSNQQLDPVKKEVAVKTIETNTKVADKIGKNEATLVINDIAIHIVRDDVKTQSEVVATVDEVLKTSDIFMANRGTSYGSASPGSLGQTERDMLYDLGKKIADVNYNYDDLKPSMQRVTRTIAQNEGYEDPIIDSFDSSDLVDLPEDSILRGTNDDAMGDIIINSTAQTNGVPAEIINLTTDSISLKQTGTASDEERVRACSTEGLLPDQQYEIVYEGDRTVLKDSNGNELLEATSPHDIEDIKAGNMLIKYDVEAARKMEEAQAEDANGNTLSKIKMFEDPFDKTYKYGLLSLDGTVLASTEFDKIYCTQKHPIPEGTNIDVQYGYGDFGYLPVVYEGNFGYATTDGNLSCLTDIEIEVNNYFDFERTPYYQQGSSESFYNAGCASIHVAEDGNVYLISGDNLISDLGNGLCSVIRPLDFGSGALWWVTVGNVHILNIGETQDWFNALIDWHGEILLSGYDDYYLSKNGKTLYTYNPNNPGKWECFEVTYTGNLAGINTNFGQSSMPQDHEVQESISQESAGQESKSQQSVKEGISDTSNASESAYELLNTASDLISSDMEGKKYTIISHLKDAQAMLENENPDAASAIGSAITLLRSGATDANAIVTLISTAQSMLN